MFVCMYACVHACEHVCVVGGGGRRECHVLLPVALSRLLSAPHMCTLHTHLHIRAHARAHTQLHPQLHTHAEVEVVGEKVDVELASDEDVLAVMLINTGVCN